MAQSFLLRRLLPTRRFFSTVSQFPPPNTTPTSLSSRMSFVFDQINAIESELAQKDQTLNRIRAWRESKKPPNPQPPISNAVKSVCEPVRELEPGLMGREVELVHPWPEWIEFVERLVNQNYFDHRRRDEEGLLEGSGFSIDDVAEEGFDFTRDWKTVQTACLHFGKDRFDIFRSLSRQDIQILVGHGCASTDKKVVFSSKLLRKHVHLDEGDVCSSCKLRNSCERAYLTTNKEDEARTIDIVRVLLTYGFHPINGSVTNESLLKIKSVKTTVRKLLHEVVKLSAVPIDPNLPPPVIKKPPPKVKTPPPPPRKRVGRDDIEMKMGDWICQKCDFMNFAKNTICLQCDAKRPKRQLLPGEWECPGCNFLNYRRNTVCFHCEHKRPPDESMENQFQDRQSGPRSRPGKVPNRDGVCNAWNFDFDDNESDGADVAAFEYADSHKMDEDFGFIGQTQGDNFKVPNADPRAPRFQERDYSERVHKKSSTGFDDFDDEEDDDIDSYELDSFNNSDSFKKTKVDFSEIEGQSASEDIEEFDQGRFPRQNNFKPHNKPIRGNRRSSALSCSEVDELDSDEDLPVRSNRKPSCIADSKQRSKGRKATSYCSDDDYGLDSDADDFAGSGRRRNKFSSHTREFKKTRGRDGDDESFSGLDSDDEGLSHRDKYKRGNSGPNRRGDYSNTRGQSSGDSRTRSNWKDTFDNDFNRSRGPRGNSREFQMDGNGGRRNRMNERSGYGNERRGGSNEKGGFRTKERSGYGDQRRGGSNGGRRNTDTNNEFESERYMRPRVNVR